MFGLQLRLPEVKRFLDKEDKHCNVGADGHSNIQFDRLDLTRGKKAGCHGHLAAVDCSEDCENKERADDVDTDLSTKPELLMLIILYTSAGDQEESNNHDRSRDSGDHGQDVGAAPDHGVGWGRGDEPFYSESSYYTGKDPQTASRHWNYCLSHLIQEGWAGETAWKSGEDKVKGDKAEVESLDKQEEDKDGEVEDLKFFLVSNIHYDVSVQYKGQ